jgi:hypothetical protein
VLLRSVLRTKPLPRRCLVRCRHCGIFFLTSPCNGGRKDLGCPFGCGLAHQRRQSTIRSVAYYREPNGKRKKSALNQKRRSQTGQGQPVVASAPCGQAPGANQQIPTPTGLIGPALDVALRFQTLSAQLSTLADPAALRNLP